VNRSKGNADCHIPNDKYRSNYDQTFGKNNNLEYGVDGAETLVRGALNCGELKRLPRTGDADHFVYKGKAFMVSGCIIGTTGIDTPEYFAEVAYQMMRAERGLRS
jgi:hypothetical protein